MRLVDWEARLDALIESRRYQPFEWGRNDCCLFAAAAVEAMTGEDYARRFPVYRTQAEAVAIMGDRGVAGIAVDVLGESVAPNLVRRGDLALVETEHGLGIAVCLGMRGALPGIRGLVFPSRHEFRCGWRV